MKRPFALVGSVYLLAQLAALSFGAENSRILGAAGAGAFLLSLLFRQARKTKVLPCIFATLAVSFSSFAWYTASFVEPAAALDGEDVTLTGVICELPERREGGYRYVLEVESIEAEDAPHLGKIRFTTVNPLRVEPYDRITGTFGLFFPENGDGFRSRDSLLSKGITMSGFLYEYEPYSIEKTEEKPLYFYALQAREALVRSLREQIPPRQSGLIAGIFLGERSGISDLVEEDFRICGISHILSVSGLHMSTVAQLLLYLFRALRIPRRGSALLAMAGVFAFMAVTGFVPSVVRSGVMYLIYLMGMAVSRQADSLNSLGIAALLLCLANPYAAGDVGMLLSVAATLGLILLSPRILAWCRARYEPLPHGKRLLDAAAGVLATSVSAMIFTLPITLLNFGSFSTVAPLANLLTLFPSTVLMGTSAAAALLYLVPLLRPLAGCFALASAGLAEYMQQCASWLANIPFASISASYGFVEFWLCGTVVLACAAAWRAGKRLYRAVACCSVLLLLAGILSYQISVRDVVRLGIVGYGESLEAAVLYNGRAAALCCGEENGAGVISFLSDHNADRLELCLAGEREEAAAAALLERYPVGNLILPAGSVFTRTFSGSLEQADAVWNSRGGTKALLFGEFPLEYCAEDRFLAAEISGLQVLFCWEDCDAAKISESWRCPDLLVLHGVPQNAELLQAGLAVIVTEEDAPAVPPVLAAGVCYAGREGDLLVDIAPNGEISLRREP